MGPLLRSRDRFSLASDAAAFLVRSKPSFSGRSPDPHHPPVDARLDAALRDRAAPAIQPKGSTRNPPGADFFRRLCGGSVQPQLPPARPPLPTTWPDAVKAACWNPVNVLDIAAGSGVSGGLPSPNESKPPRSPPWIGPVSPPSRAESPAQLQCRRPATGHRRRHPYPGFRHGLPPRHPGPYSPQRGRSPLAPPPAKSLRCPGAWRHHRHRRVLSQ